MEDMVSATETFWRGRSVMLTGHTGFKGGWLALWLHRLGAKVHGYALDPSTAPNLFEAANIGETLASDTRADLSDLNALAAAFDSARPEIVLHLAAQPLVRASYAEPLYTWVTNTVGTAHVLEAARLSDSVRAVILITTDKVYENREWAYPYREVDSLGGRDPYSASKAAAEMVAASYRESFFGKGTAFGHPAKIATVRAGNVIGGGDWAIDRLVPDCLRAFAKREPVRLRYPHSVRPWQHVLEPLSGYLRLAEHLLEETEGDKYARAWNFGPDADGEVTVADVANSVASLWGAGARVEQEPTTQSTLHEAGLLRLDSTMARTMLGWRPRWSLSHALDRTVAWHRAWLQREDMLAFSLEQIAGYESLVNLHE